MKKILTHQPLDYILTFITKQRGFHHFDVRDQASAPIFKIDILCIQIIGESPCFQKFKWCILWKSYLHISLIISHNFWIAAGTPNFRLRYHTRPHKKLDTIVWKNTCQQVNNIKLSIPKGHDNLKALHNVLKIVLPLRPWGPLRKQRPMRLSRPLRLQRHWGCRGHWGHWHHWGHWGQ